MRHVNSILLYDTVIQLENSWAICVKTWIGWEVLQMWVWAIMSQNKAWWHVHIPHTPFNPKPFHRQAWHKILAPLLLLTLEQTADWLCFPCVIECWQQTSIRVSDHSARVMAKHSTCHWVLTAYNWQRATCQCCSHSVHHVLARNTACHHCWLLWSVFETVRMHWMNEQCHATCWLVWQGSQHGQ